MEEMFTDMATVNKHIKAIIQLRRARESEWIEVNPILRAGEPALSIDVMRVKVGNGTTDWVNLRYIDDTIDEQIKFVNSLDGLVGKENQLYINKTDGTAYLWKENTFVEMESSSIEDLKQRMSTNEEQITTHTEQIAELSEEISRGADKNYIHKQQTASDLWTVVHNLGKFPSITVVDSAGTVVTGEIVLQTTEQAVISFNGAFSGKAYCN